MEMPPEQEAEHTQQLRRIQRGRNRVLALLLIGFVVLFYFITIAKMQH